MCAAALIPIVAMAQPLPEDTRTLEALTDSQAETLAKTEGFLWLDGLTTLSDTQAEACATHTGLLSLGGLKTLSDTQAAALAKHRGTLVLEGLIRLSDNAAEILRANPKIRLPDAFRNASGAKPKL